MSRLALFVGILLSFLSAVSSLEHRITAAPGMNVTLQCQVPSNISILSVRCNNPELGPDYMFFYQDGQCITDYQHSSFKHRVTLKDNNIIDGNLSLILRNVSTNDTRTYTCKIIDTEKRRWETVFNLTVGNEFANVTGQTAGNTQNVTNKGGRKRDGNSRVVVGVTVAAMIIFLYAL